VRDVLPVLWVMIAVLLIMTYVPDVVLFLPKADGLQGLALVASKAARVVHLRAMITAEAS